MHTNKAGMFDVALGAGALFFTPAASGGVFNTFDDRSGWLAAVSGPIIAEGFEGRDALGPLDAPSIFETGLGVAATGPATDTSLVESGDPFNIGLQNTTVGGSQYVRFGGPGGFSGDYTMQFLLPQSTSAFGFDISDWEPGLIADGQQGASVALLNDGELVIGFNLGSTQDVSGTLAFIGFTSDTFVFNEVRFTVKEVFDPSFGAASFDITGVDEVSWAVPSPGGAAAFVLAGVLASRRRREEDTSLYGSQIPCASLH